MSDRIDELVGRLRADATACAGRDECMVPLMYCAFGPADDCAEYAALWLRVLAERDALLAEHEMWTAFVASGRMMNALLSFEAAHDNAERVIHGE